MSGSESLKKKTISGLTWSTIERFSTQGLQFLITIIIARLLTPSDFGLIGMINIFIALSFSLIDSGFSAALIQKKDRTQTDLSTVFFFNLGISFVLYLIILLFSPLIANFYKEQQLLLLVKVISINIIILSLSIIQTTIYSINLNFRVQAKASLISVFFSGAIGIFLAYFGFGVWALVWQTIAKNTLNVALLWFYSKWKPDFCFSRAAFTSLFPFGSKLLLAGFLYTLFENLYLVIIGKYFNSKDLGYYVKAKNFSNLPSTSITAIFLRVTFPILSSIQDDEERLIAGYQKIMRFTIFVTFPLIILLAVISEPLVLLLLTDKWYQAAYFLKLLCFVMLWFPLNEINVNILKVKAKSGVVLKLAIIRILITVSIIIVTIPYGLKAIILGQVLSAFLTFIAIYLYTGKFISINLKLQFIEILHYMVILLIIASIVNLFNRFAIANLLKILIESTLFLGLYFLYSRFAFRNESHEIITILKGKFLSTSKY